MEGYKAEYATLFFALLDSINRNNWRETELEYGYIIYKSKIGKRAYLEGRRWLDENGFISHVPGRGDYAKAKFAVHGAVLAEVQKRTAKRTAKRVSAVPDAVQSEVQKCTASNTAERTAFDTASDTASRTHNTEDLINPVKPLKPKDEESKKKNDDDGVFEEDFEEKKLPDWASEEKKQMLQTANEIQSPRLRGTPLTKNKPELTRDDLEKHLWGLSSAREQMGRSLKLYSDLDYANLINRFLSEKIEDKKVWDDDVDCGANFRNWIPYQSLKSKPTSANGNNAINRNSKTGNSTAQLSRDDNDYR